MSTLITRRRGDVVEIDVAVTNQSTGAARNLTGETLVVQVAKLGERVISDITCTLTDPTNGIAYAEIPTATTTNLNGEYEVTVVLTTAAGKPYTVADGVLRFTNRPQ